MSLEKIVQLKPEESELLFSGQIGKETIEVREWEKYRWLHLSDKSVQTLMQMDSIDQVALPNIQALLAVLLFCTSPKSLLNLGLGGASLERYLDSKWPDLKIRSVESNEQVIRLAKDYFHLPDSVDVIHDQADHFMAAHDDIYDIILCDIFVADTQASCLYDKKFYSDISRCISEGSILAINILPESEDDVVNMLLPLKDYFSHIYLLEFADYSNAIIFASNQKAPDRDKLKKNAEDLYEKTQLDLRDIPDRLNTILETV